MSNHMFHFEVDKSALLLLNKAVNKYLEKWPGGSPVEQASIKAMKLELDKALLDLSFLSDDE